VLCAAGLGIAGCTLAARPKAIDLENLPSSALSSQQLLQGLAERNKQLRSLRALASVRYQGKDGKGKFQEAVLVERPDKLRLETISPFGVVLILTANADELTVLQPREGVFVRGKSTSESLLLTTKIPLSLDEVTALLMGLPPLESGESWREDKESFERSGAKGKKELLKFHPKLGTPLLWERTLSDGAVEVKAEFSEFITTAAGPFPARISINFPAKKQTVEILYEEPEINAKLSSDLFVQKKPAGVKEIPIEASKVE